MVAEAVLDGPIPVIPPLRRLKEEDGCEFKVILKYIMISGLA